MTLARSNLDWGSVPAWASIAATLLVFLAGLWVLRGQGTVLRLQRKEISDLRTARERDQARRVVAWVSHEGAAPVLIVRNGSPAPAFDVRVDICTAPAFEPHQATYRFWSMLPPESSPSGDAFDNIPWVVDTVHFTDDGGRHWLRRGSHLEEVAEGAERPC